MSSGKGWKVASGFLVICAVLSAQIVSSSIVGTLTDPGNAVVPGVEVVLTNLGTGVVNKTNSNSVGLFRFPTVLTGRYSITVHATGFKGYSQTEIVISASETRDLGTITLQLGSLAEQVTVTAEAAALQTASSEQSSLVSGTQLSSIALRARDFFGMMSLLPGVVDTRTREATSASGGMGGLSYSGSSYLMSNYQVDGITANDTGSNNDIHFNGNVDAIAEIRVLTSNYQAEYGRKSGATISVITKGGDRDLHGSAYWSHRHEEFNANSFFNNRSSLLKSPYRFNVPGYSVGGPISLGGFNRTKDKLFFFFAQEYTRQRINLTTQYRIMPTAVERAGDFSQSVDTSGKQIKITDWTTGGQFPNNKIPASMIDPTGQAIVNFLPAPNYVEADPSLVYQRNYVAAASGIYPRRNDTLRIDANPSPRLRVYWRLINEPETMEAPWGGWGSGSNNFMPPTWYRRGRPGRGQAVNATYSFSSTLVNEFVFGKSYSHIYYGLVDEAPLSRSNFNRMSGSGTRATPRWQKVEDRPAGIPAGVERRGPDSGRIVRQHSGEYPDRQPCQHPLRELERYLDRVPTMSVKSGAITT